jgi:hypothetical protein
VGRIANIANPSHKPVFRPTEREFRRQHKLICAALKAPLALQRKSSANQAQIKRKPSANQAQTKRKPTRKSFSQGRPLRQK